MNGLQKVEFNGTLVLTTQQIAEAYETDTKIIQKNFSRNKERYIEGKHFICLEGEELKEFKTKRHFDDSSRLNKLYLWTQKGAFLHAKSLNTDKAWDVYDALVDEYFQKRNELALSGISKELQAVIVVDKRVPRLRRKWILSGRNLNAWNLICQSFQLKPTGSQRQYASAAWIS